MAESDSIAKLSFDLFGKLDEKSLEQAGNKINQWKNMLVKGLGILGIGLSIKNMNSLAEQFDGINDSIRGATRELGDQEEIQRRIMEAADSSREGYDSMARSVTDLVKQNPSINIERAVKYSEQFTKLLKAAGKSSGEVSSAASMMNRVFAAGSMEAGTLTRMMRMQPEIVNLLTDTLGKSREELQQMAKDGKLTTDVILDVFEKSSDTIQKHFEENALNFSDLTTYARNHWGQFCAYLWDKGGVFNDLAGKILELEKKVFERLEKNKDEIARVIKLVTDGIGKIVGAGSRILDFAGKIVNSLGGIDRVLETIIGLVGMFLGMKAFQSIFNGIKSLMSILSPTTALFMLLYLVIDDLFHFMIGDESVIGDILEDMGINADEAREKIKDFFKACTDVPKKLKPVADLLKDVFSAVKDYIGESYDRLADIMNSSSSWATMLKEGPQKTLEGIKKLLEGIRDIITDDFWKIDLFEDFKNGFKETKEGFGRLGKHTGKAGEGILETIFGIGETAIGAAGVRLEMDTGFRADGQESARFAHNKAPHANRGGKKVEGGVGRTFATEEVEVDVKVNEASLEQSKEEVKTNFQTASEEGTETVKLAVLEMNESNKEATVEMGKEAGEEASEKAAESIEGPGKEAIKSASKEAGEEAGRELVSGIEGTMSDLASKAVGWATDFVTGFARGINENKGIVTQAVSEMAGEVAAQTHFSHPDKGPLADYETWMPDMVRGLASGISENSGLLVGEIADMAEKMKNAMLPAVNAMNMTALVGAGGGIVNNSSRNIMQSVSISNMFQGGDRAAQLQGAKAMDKSAKDATTYMAEALTFGG